MIARPSTSWAAPILVAGAATLAVATLGASMTRLDGWYHALRQPGWAPPDAAYGAAWTAIYALIALAAVAGWTSARTRAEAEWVVGAFALNGFLNIVWSLLFFRLHRPDWAAAEAMLLWLSVASLVVVAGRSSRTATLLLLPYLAWVSFALALNLAVVRLNGPFG